MNTIEIKESKRKLALMILGSLIFIILGILLAINPDRFVSTIFRNTGLIRISGIIATIFFGLCLIIFIKKSFSNNFSLIINEKGINDNSSYVSVGMILWNDIISIKSIEVMSTKFLIIKVKDPDKYLNTENGIKKKLQQRNLDNYGTPISISSNTLSYNFNELEEVIAKFYNEYKNR